MVDMIKQVYDSEDRKELFDLLNRHAQWLVIMQAVIVHASAEYCAPSGLFGLLGDAPIQVVDARDTRKIDALYSLAQACEADSSIKYPQDLRQPVLNEMEEELRSYAKPRFDDQTTVTSILRPAIIFYQCPNMCNHPGKVKGPLWYD